MSVRLTETFAITRLFMQRLAPAGTPLNTSDVWSAIAARPASATDAECRFEALLHESGLACRHSLPVSSGRAGMVLILRAIAEMRGEKHRRAVLVPAYTCYSVAASVLNAGLELRLCDTAPSTLSVDAAELEARCEDDVLAVLSANLFGQPDDLPAMERVATSTGVDLVDDAAQALGASIDGRPCGTFGTAGLFSFDKGKVLTTIQGGAVTSNDTALVSRLKRQFADLPAPGLSARFLDLAKVYAYLMLLPPNRYWVTRYLPGLNLGSTPFEREYPITRLTTWKVELACVLLGHLGSIARQRAANADFLRASLTEDPRFSAVAPRRGSICAPIRLPVLAENTALRERALAALEPLGCSRSYPAALRDVPELASHLEGEPDTPNARNVAARIFTLPVHPYVKQSHLEVIADTLRSL